MKFKEIASILSGGGYNLGYTTKGLQGTGWRRAYRISNTSKGAIGYYGEFCISGEFNNANNIVIPFTVSLSYENARIKIGQYAGVKELIDKIRVTKKESTNEIWIDFHYTSSAANVYGFKKMIGFCHAPQVQEAYSTLETIPDQPEGETILAEEEIL